MNQKKDKADSSKPAISVDDIIDEAYRGLLNREPDPIGKKTYQRFLDDGLQNSTLRIAQMLRSCISSPEFSAARAAAGRTAEPLPPGQPIGPIAGEAAAVFGSFSKYRGAGRPGYVTNFLGCITDIGVSYGINGRSGTVEDYPFAGNFHGGTMEWVGTLKAVLGADRAFRMLELGAGWGPWCAIGYAASVQRGISDIKVVGVEGDSGHVKFMHEHFADNNLRPECYAIVPGIVAVKDGEALFPRASDPSQVYGGAPAFYDSGDRQHPLVGDAERVPAYSLETLTADLPVVDLIHCDIQGGELDLFTHAIELMSQKVKYVVIGTHSRQIDRGLIGVFASRGWVLEGAEDSHYEAGVLSADGTQVWRNPRLVP